MKKLILTLGILAMAWTLSTGTARADDFPWNSHLITGDAKLNKDIKRPGPYTPKPKPSSSSSSTSSVNTIQVSCELTGTVQVVIQDIESGQSYSMTVLAGDYLVLPDSEEGYVVTVYQNGVRTDSTML